MSAPEKLPQEWVERANTVDIEALARRCGAVLKASGAERIGPCPACGGTDRFAVNVAKNIFTCRVGGAGGGPINLLRYLDGLSFREAVLELTGEQDPAADKDAPAKPRPAPIRTAPAQPTQKDNPFRSRARSQAYALWKGGERRSSQLAAYFDVRGIGALRDGTRPWLDRLRLAPALNYTHKIDGEWRVIHTGPAMLAAIVGPDGRFIGLHRTWIDLDQPNGKAVITHPATGEVLASKKVLGSQQGGHIDLDDPAPNGVPCARVVIGEGIETVVAWRVMDDDGEPFASWSGVNIKNIAGRSARTVPHPTKTRTDRRGRVYPTKVPGPDPDPADTDSLIVPDRFDGVMLLGDGDSDPFATRCDMARAERRHALKSCGTPRKFIGTDWAPAGGDFNDALIARNGEGVEA